MDRDGHATVLGHKDCPPVFCTWSVRITGMPRLFLSAPIEMPKKDVFLLACRLNPEFSQM